MWLVPLLLLLPQQRQTRNSLKISKSSKYKFVPACYNHCTLLLAWFRYGLFRDLSAPASVVETLCHPCRPDDVCAAPFLCCFVVTGSNEFSADWRENQTKWNETRTSNWRGRLGGLELLAGASRIAADAAATAARPVWLDFKSIFFSWW